MQRSGEYEGEVDEIRENLRACFKKQQIVICVKCCWETKSGENWKVSIGFAIVEFIGDMTRNFVC